MLDVEHPRSSCSCEPKWKEVAEEEKLEPKYKDQCSPEREENDIGQCQLTTFRSPRL